MTLSDKLECVGHAEAVYPVEGLVSKTVAALAGRIKADTETVIVAQKTVRFFIGITQLF